MPLLYNVDHLPASISPAEPSVMPGGSYEFTDEQISAGLSGSWSAEDPRSGLEAEREWKADRDEPAVDLVEREPEPPAEPAAEPDDVPADAGETHDPAESGNHEE